MHIGAFTFFIILAFIVGVLAGFFLSYAYAKSNYTSLEQKAKEIIDNAKKEAENIKREKLAEAKEKIYRERKELEREFRDRKRELQALEKRLSHREENIDKRITILERRERNLEWREREIKKKEEELDKEFENYRKELERIAGLTVEEARNLLLKKVEHDAKFEAQKLINKIEEEARRTADRKAKEILISAMQRLAPEVVQESTITTIPLPSDEMKGRIIGREGRNIRTLELLTGVDIIIDDTPEIVVISSFDPVRREIARLALERLIADGRIHPARIEEVVEKVKRDFDRMIIEEGEKAAFELNIQGLTEEELAYIGILKYRTSYGQNVLEHSKEVAYICGILAAELGLDVERTKRAGLLHDIGKGNITEKEGAHALIGAEMARRAGEDPMVVNMIAAHHYDKDPESLEAIIVQIADAISASRPGSRKETLDAYIKRLEHIEGIAKQFSGVEKAYSIQAGRELRVIVSSDEVSDEEMETLARGIAKRIESELKYPGIIKVTVIREKRIVEYAK